MNPTKTTQDRGVLLVDAPMNAAQARALLQLASVENLVLAEQPTPWQEGSLPDCANGLKLACWDEASQSYLLSPLMELALLQCLEKSGNLGAKLFARSRLLAELAQNTGDPAVGGHSLPEIAEAGDPQALVVEVAGLKLGAQHLFEQGKFSLLLFQRHEAPALFHELSRLREITFRDAGQGGGAAVDITPEDDYYHQLVLWDNEALRLAGAYRLGITEDVLRENGPDAFYLSHVFHIEPEFFEKLGPAIELTRSFLHPDYQREPLALALLWRGLGQVVAARPQVRSLFGSVTVPATVSDASRAVLVEFLQRHHREDPTLCSLIRPRMPFEAPGSTHKLLVDAHGDDAIEALRDVIRASDGSPRHIPPLIRHYLSLNARFIDYHVEREFGNALYCLLRVDLSKAPRPHLRRFIGESAADRLLES